MHERPVASLGTVARAWTWIGLSGFGGPPAHIALLRRLVVEREAWLDAREFEDANAACGMLPGPASTQLAIFCAYRVGGIPGALVGGLGFIAPAVVVILALSVAFLAHSPPLWIRGAGAGAGAAVAAVAAAAARSLIGPSYTRARGHAVRWAAYIVAGALAAALIGAYLVLVLLACGAAELAVVRARSPASAAFGGPLVAVHIGGLGSLVWTALKVGALSFGGGFVIIPLMQGDAVHAFHWMTNAQFLNAVALGQITPGPVVATVAAVGYAAHGVLGGVLAALVAFTPSFGFVILGGRRFERLRANASAQAFLQGAGPAAIGAILGAAVLLAGALREDWQFALLAAAAVALLLARRGVVETLLAAGAIGVIAVLAGAPAP
ncbi:MAG TPA: chromate efflux transporter [Solirubrobacteraceae bacterium]|nr:chromate efflux transporter [Solirubrobacteraceae bacterium]